jgi:hypothetical protein
MFRKFMEANRKLCYRLAAFFPQAKKEINDL